MARIARKELNLIELQREVAETSPEVITDYFRFAFDKNFGLTLHVSTIAMVIVITVIALILLIRLFMFKQQLTYFELDEAEFGWGDQKIKFKPNDLDRTVAYKIWVELSTRKIGLPIDLDNDVIDEIYGSWYEFFSVTRELVKDIPVGKVRRDSTQKIINLSIEVLNMGMRPHLTRWQARFRRWYAYQLTEDAKAAFHPQDIQRKFPEYDELVEDMLAINEKLMAYRHKMYTLVTGLQESDDSRLT